MKYYIKSTLKQLYKSMLLLGFLSLSMTMVACQDKTNEKASTSENQPSELSEQAPKEEPVVVQRRPNVSQQFIGIDTVNVRLASVLDEVPYQTDGLSDFAQSVNTAVWSQVMPNPPPADENLAAKNEHVKNPSKQPSKAKKEPVLKDPISAAQIIRIQALLNWHHHSVGAVDGKMSNNTIKAMQIFQKAKNLPITEHMDSATWQALSADENLMQQPVLVRYTLTDKDVRIGGGRSGYHSVSEAVAERFHMSRKLLEELNPNITLKAGNTITVYNPYQPNEVSIKRVVIERDKNILYAYDEADNLVASYPTTINRARTPKGTYKVANRVVDPSYNKDFRNKNSVIGPGPNNPVGRVWIGISKPSFGIHGSPEPELISRQTSAGCVRLTNWDALGLFGAIEEGAIVEFM